jgi:RND family efflux transporter MFP subunit
MRLFRRTAIPFVLAMATAAPVGVLASDLPSTTVDWTTVSRERSFDGAVEAERRSTVSSQVAARIEELPFDVDDYVERGDIIVRFRNLPASADLKQAEAAEQEARARLQEARASHGRIQMLYEQQRVSKADMDRATADLQSTEARVAAAEGAVAGARERYENTIVRAPFSGIVVERHVELGEMATVGMPLMTGLSLEHLRVVVDVPQSDIGALRRDAEAWVDLPDGSSLPAQEVRIFPYADPATHTFRVRLKLS